MTPSELQSLAQQIVSDAKRLHEAHSSESNPPVNYVAVFAQSDGEYEELIDAVRQFGSAADDTPTGPVFYIAPLNTDAGMLRLLKIRRPDPKRRERGDADFTVSDYQAFKRVNLGRPGFSLIERPQMEMIELIDPLFNVLAYYSFPTLATVLKLNIDP